VTRRHELRGVLFDWDGTLLDSYDADAQASLASMRELGVHWSLELFERHYSPNWYRSYLAARLPPAKWDAADRIWRKHYRDHHSKLMPGARRVLAILCRRHRLGLVTSGDRSRVRQQLRQFRLTQRFAACVCAGDTRHRKPHPAPLQLALKRMRLRPAECVYVGDSPEDLEMSRRAGVRAVAVLGPFPTEKRLRAARPELLLESLDELPGALRKIQS